jgi:hypothetical protein
MIKQIILLGACVSLMSGCCTAPLARTNWEYQIVDARLFVELMNAINQRAKDGWELMSVHPAPPNSELAYAVMRRPKK